jgi:peptidoglycan/LPS O-acetylase OafA/YrhL
MKEIRSLTGLRGIAALIVFLVHTRDTLETRGIVLHFPTLFVRLFLMSGRQVDIFFVLSGFILAMIYQRWFAGSVTRKSQWKFLQRRFARIYPLHAFMLIMVLLFVAAAHVLHANTINGLDRFTFSTLPATILLVHAWGFLGYDPGPWNPPSWSVSIEALAYLLFPYYIWLTFKVQEKRPWIVFVAVAACGLALNATTHWGLAGYAGIARGLSEFALGCATIGFYNSPIARRLQTSAGSVAALIALAVCFALTPDTGFVIGLFTAPLLLAMCADNPASRLFGWTPIYFLGEISFSIYLGHFLYSTIAYRLISVPWMRTGTMPLIVGTCGIVVFVLAASTLTYFAVERPGRDLLRGRNAPPPPERVGNAASPTTGS